MAIETIYLCGKIVNKRSMRQRDWEREKEKDGKEESENQREKIEIFRKMLKFFLERVKE